MLEQRRPEHPPGSEINAPHLLGGRAEGLKQSGQTQDNPSLPFQYFRSKPQFQRSRPGDLMLHSGDVTPRVIHKLILLALASRDLGLDVREYLEGISE